MRFSNKRKRLFPPRYIRWSADYLSAFPRLTPGYWPWVGVTLRRDNQEFQCQQLLIPGPTTRSSFLIRGKTVFAKQELEIRASTGAGWLCISVQLGAGQCVDTLT